MKMHFSPIAFTIVSCCTYALVFWLNRPMFIYYPQTGIWHWGSTPLANAPGPAMAWYGLMADAGLMGLILAIMVPNRTLDGLRNYIWIFPLGAMAVCVYLLRVFFK